ncbi:hypothetical protein EDB84DRAFT_1442588 [Lactarius hengduanensis]|nr:hypothetical protein EDB84DRAFT_1442588 [Lactarius hengduanensis]
MTDSAASNLPELKDLKLHSEALTGSLGYHSGGQRGEVEASCVSPVTEARGPALPSEIAQEAIEPTDDYQLPQTPIVHDPASRVAPVSVADTVSDSASNSPASVCDVANSRAEASASHSVPLVLSSVPPCVSISPSISLSSGPESPDPSRDSSYVSPSVLGSVPASAQLAPSGPSCELPMRSEIGYDGRKIMLSPPPHSTYVADTVSNPTKSSASDRTNAPCGILPPVTGSHSHVLTLSIPVQAYVIAKRPASPLAFLLPPPSPRASSIPPASPLVSPIQQAVPLSLSVSSSVPGPERPQSALQVPHAIISRPRWPQCIPKSAPRAAMCLFSVPERRQLAPSGPREFPMQS